MESEKNNNTEPTEQAKNKITSRARTFLIAKDIIILEMILVLYGFAVYYSFKNNMDRDDQLCLFVFFSVLTLFSIVNLLKNVNRTKK